MSDKQKFMNDPEYFVIENVWVFDGIKIHKVDWIAISQSFGTIFPYPNILYFIEGPEDESITELKKLAGDYFNKNVEFHSNLLADFKKRWKEFDENPMGKSN